jgi:sulfofructose kinase
MEFKHPTSASASFNIPFDRAKPFDVVGLGMNAVDHMCLVHAYPGFDTKTEILRYEMLPGGPVATAVVFASRMGLQSRYIGKVGSDTLGQLQLESLRRENIDTSSVMIEPGARNQYAVIVVDQKSGERTVLWGRDPALNFRQEELSKEQVCSGRLLHLDGADYAAALRAATWAQEEGIPVVIDIDKVIPHCEQLVGKVDFLIASSNFTRDLTGLNDLSEGLQALQKITQGFVAVTIGVRGAVALVGGECVQFPACKVEAVDTTGAGDIFHGAFIYGLLQNWSLGGIMRFANGAAGLSCTRLGARSGIAPLEEILRFCGLEDMGRTRAVMQSERSR